MFVSSEEKMIDKLSIHDGVAIIIDIDEKEFRLNASIRWAGTNSVHSKRGYGLEFDEESRVLAEKLHLQLDSKGVFFVPE